MKETAHRINARALAEFALEGGDLFSDMRLSERLREGVLAHMAAQKRYPEGWESEVTIRREETVLGVELAIYGRMDGLWRRADADPLIEEIKSTRMADPSRIGPDDYPVHWAQAHIYAYMLAANEDRPSVDARLTYRSVDGPSVSYTRTFSARRLRELFLSYAEPYARWVALLGGWEAESRPTMRAMSFPYDGYREGQREMAKNVYQAIRGGQTLLCQAPTGIGKTAAALFPAIKAVGEGLTERVFYLTARTTARQAAEDALDRMRERGLKLRSVTLTAKEKVCFSPGARCHPDECPYAAGYFDRRRGALTDAVGMERFSRPEIEELAREYEICPFELSLDLCETAEAVICDYNYVFDPVVRLKRFFEGKCDAALLIDEAHNLAGRAREMFSAELKYADLLKLRREISASEGKKTPLYEATAALVKAIRALCKDLDAPSSETEPPSALYAPVDAFAEAAREKLQPGLPYHATLIECYFAALGYQRVCDDFDESYRALLFCEKSAHRVKLWCMDPSERLRKTLSRVSGATLFSGTLTPMRYYARLSGVRPDLGDALLELPSPFPPENLLVLRLPLDTRFRVRQETADTVARAILEMCLSRVGNYMACFPSHAYLQLVYERFLLVSAGRARAIRQEAGMREEQRAEFLAKLEPGGEKSLAAFVAMGGVFAEGIDLPGDRLLGAAIVGVGLPQPDFERSLLCEAWDDDGGDEGRAFAYVYPGMERVLQAAGRVIRSETDRGVVLLIDDRYAAEEYRRLMPDHWRVRPAKDAASARALMQAFWRQGRREKETR